MADTKTTGLTALTGAGTASNDVIPIADVSATTTKKQTIAELILALQALGIGTGLGASTVTTLGVTGNVTITDVNVILSASTGTKIGTATTQKLGFYNATPVVQQSAYTQTYATASKTHANPTAAVLTVTDGAGTNDGTIGAITGDASVIAAVQELAAQINKLVADVANVKQVLNSVIDDGQIYGLLA